MQKIVGDVKAEIDEFVKVVGEHLKISIMDIITK